MYRRTLQDSEWVWLLAAALNLLAALAFLALATMAVWLAIYPPEASALDWPWQSPAQEQPPPEPPSPLPAREKAPPPPKVQPYRIPRYDGRTGGDFHHIPPVKLSRQIDADALFRMIVNCYPIRPDWRGIEVKAVAGARYAQENTISTFDTSGLSRYYAGIVAEMPLYAPDENFRVRQQEAQRRENVARDVAALLKALADRDRALRMIGIGESVEARSQIRVQEGIAPAEEQIGYLKEVASSVGDLDTANAAIVAARLALAGQCRDEVVDQVNDYLKTVTSEPR